LRRTTEQAENLMFLHLPARLAKALLRLSDSDGKVAVTQKDLGNIIGMSRESTNRQLRLWEEQGWVRLERGGIVILSAEALERIAESDTEGG
jgi:CRP-like cAMP-binding protein